MLESILGSRSKVKILRFFFKDIERDYSLDDVSKGTGLSFGTVHPAMGQLTDSRIIIVRKIGRTRVYRLNRANRLFKELSALFKAEGQGLKKLAFKFVVMSNKKGLKNVVLFGSVARGEYTAEAGDVDLLFICKDENALERFRSELDELAQHFLEEYDIVISPLLLTEAEYKNRSAALDSLTLNIQAEGKVLFGDSEWQGM